MPLNSPILNEPLTILFKTCITITLGASSFLMFVEKDQIRRPAAVQSRRSFFDRAKNEKKVNSVIAVASALRSTHYS